jgi:hypothetical protein
MSTAFWLAFELTQKVTVYFFQSADNADQSSLRHQAKHSSFPHGDMLAESYLAEPA